MAGAIAGGLTPTPGAGQVEIQVVRELVQSDLEELLRPSGPVAPQGGALKQLRFAHHQLARYVALGYNDVTASAMTGYSPATIARLRKYDPSFIELVAHYSAERDVKFGELNDLMLQLGRTTLEELQAQMEEKPESFTVQQKMDLFELMAVKGRAAPGSAHGPRDQASGAASGGVTVNVKFVGAEGPTAQTVTITPDGDPV
jgi:hypothetical protein